jgi:hypothetical protein
MFAFFQYNSLHIQVIQFLLLKHGVGNFSLFIDENIKFWQEAQGNNITICIDNPNYEGQITY